LLNENDYCACLNAKRLHNFLDPTIQDEISKHATPVVHVRTMDTGIIQHIALRRAVSYSLNNIPLKPTSLAKCIATVLDAYEQMVSLFNLESLDFPIDQARAWIQNTCNIIFIKMGVERPSKITIPICRPRSWNRVSLN